MLFFYPASESTIQAAATEGLSSDDGIRLYDRLEDALQVSETILVVDGLQLRGSINQDSDGHYATHLPAAAIANADPYLKPEPVAAAGGYVVRYDKGVPEVLMIFRRGVWDLPKGKLDPGETPEDCALREVREEVGIEELTLVRALDETEHGYPEAGRYRVKTTWWFLMRTPERSFEPEVLEHIERVAWFKWPEAKQRVGYETLRLHMEEIEARIPGAVESAER